MEFRDDELEVLDWEVEFEMGRKFVHVIKEVFHPGAGDVVGCDTAESGVMVALRRSMYIVHICKPTTMASVSIVTKLIKIVPFALLQITCTGSLDKLVPRTYTYPDSST